MRTRTIFCRCVWPKVSFPFKASLTFFASKFDGHVVTEQTRLWKSVAKTDKELWERTQSRSNRKEEGNNSERVPLWFKRMLGTYFSPASGIRKRITVYHGPTDFHAHFFPSLSSFSFAVAVVPFLIVTQSFFSVLSPFGDNNSDFSRTLAVQ